MSCFAAWNAYKAVCILPCCDSCKRAHSKNILAKYWGEDFNFQKGDVCRVARVEYRVLTDTILYNMTQLASLTNDTDFGVRVIHVHDFEKLEYRLTRRACSSVRIFMRGIESVRIERTLSVMAEQMV